MKIVPKYQQGAGVNLIAYTPLPTTTGYEGGSVETSSASSSSTKKDNDDYNLLSKDIIKELMSNGLPSDVQNFLEKSNLFKTSIFDLGLSESSKSAKYARDAKQLILYVQKMKHEKKQFEDALTQIKESRAETEVAISSNGGVYVVRDGELALTSVEGLKEGETPLTNIQLAHLRANSPQMAYNSTIIDALHGATSMSEIDTIIRNSITSIGGNDSSSIIHLNSRTANSEQLANILAQVNLTYNDLKSMSADKLLQLKIKNNSNENQVMGAITTVLSQLNQSQRTLLKYRAKELQIPDVRTLILEMMTKYIKGGPSVTDVGTLNLDSSSSSGDGSDSLDKMQLTPVMSAALGRGAYADLLLVNGASTAIHTRGIQVPITENGNVIKSYLPLQFLQNSDFSGNLDFKNVSFGGHMINSNMLGELMNTDTKGKIVDLPIDAYEKTRGNIVPDLDKATRVGAAQAELGNLKPDSMENKMRYNQVYAKHGLPEPYDANGNYREELYSRFLVLPGLASEKAFINSDEVSISNYVQEVDEESVRDNFRRQMQKDNEDYSLGDGFLGMGKDALYESSIYIPFTSSVYAASMGSGQNLSLQNSTKIYSLEQQNQRQKQQDIKIRSRVNTTR